MMGHSDDDKITRRPSIGGGNSLDSSASRLDPESLTSISPSDAPATKAEEYARRVIMQGGPGSQARMQGMQMEAGLGPDPFTPRPVQPVEPVRERPQDDEPLDPSAVWNLSLGIQRGFRRKMLTILLMQLVLTMVVGLVLRFCFLRALTTIFPAQSIQTLLLGMGCLILLPCLTAVRDRHPWNMICTTLWTLAWATFLAAAQVPGGVVKSNALFVIFGSTVIGVASLLVLSTCGTWVDPDTGIAGLPSFRMAGWISWVILLAGMITVYMLTKDIQTLDNDGVTLVPFYENAGHVIVGIGVGSLIFAWVVFDSDKLCERMMPDDYMKGVVYFYTDFLMVCCCCLFVGCLSAGAS